MVFDVLFLSDIDVKSPSGYFTADIPPSWSILTLVKKI